MPKTHILIQWEEKYRKLLSPIDLNPDRLLEYYLDLMRFYAQWINKIDQTSAHLPKSMQGRFDEVIKAYRQDITANQKQHSNWLLLLGGFLWSDLIWTRLKKISKTQKTKYQEEMIPAIWQKLLDQYRANQLQGQDLEIVKNYLLLKHTKKGTILWLQQRNALKKLLLEKINAQFHKDKECMHRRLETVLYSHELEPQMSETVRDHLKAYSSRSAKMFMEKKKEVDYILTSWRKHIHLQLIRKVSLRIVLAALLMVVYVKSNVNERFLNPMVIQIQKIFRIDPESRRIAENKNFFYNQLVNIEPEKLSAQVEKSIAVFLEQKENYSSQDQHYYFVKHILAPFLLIINDEDSVKRLGMQVIDAAQALDGKFENEVIDFIRIYNTAVILESELRGLVLRLRTKFVAKKVFVFSFIVLNNNSPIIFLIPDKVVSYINIERSKLEKLLPEKIYYGYIPELITLYVVSGKDYPFKGRAGYFDGQFAVVFQSMAASIGWTAWHELGHLVDYFRELVQNISQPPNHEVNAMMFPLMFTSKHDLYLRERIGFEYHRRDKRDLYAQAAKGVINGFILKLKENKLIEEGFPLASDAFEMQIFDRVAGILGGLEQATINQWAQAMLMRPDYYLNTAKDALFLVDQGLDGQEIVRGAHGVVQRGYILKGRKYGSTNVGRGPQFIHSGVVGIWDSEVPFDLTLFLKNVFGIVFQSAKYKDKISKTESIAASVTVFILFELSALILSLLSRSHRRRKFNGTDTNVWIDQVYDQSPISHGRDIGEEKRERHLLRALFRCKDKIPDALKKDVGIFKSNSSEAQRFLFDCLLLLAPFNPKKSQVKNFFHDLLFWLPWIGPYCARWPKFLKRQIHFDQKERFNRHLTETLLSLRDEDQVVEIREHMHALLDQYASRELQTSTQNMEYDGLIHQFEHEVLGQIGWMGKQGLKKSSKHTMQLGTEDLEFDRLRQYRRGDNVRRIDWKASARGNTDNLIMRHFHGHSTKPVQLFLDLREMNHPKGLKTIAESMIKALDALHKEQSIEQIIYLLPTKELVKKAKALCKSKNDIAFVYQVLADVKNDLKEIIQQRAYQSFQGFQFYTKEENNQLMPRFDLTDFKMGTHQEAVIPTLLEKYKNIFIVGVSPKQQPAIQSVINHTNSGIFF